MDLIALRNRVLGYAVAVLLAYPFILLMVRRYESRLIFFPDDPGRLTGDWHPKGLPVEDVRLKTGDGVEIHAWWIPNPQADITFLAFHGNAGNVADRADVYRLLWNTPANVLAVEYRGYGRSEGAPSEAGLYQDAEGAYDYLVRVRGIEPRSLVSFGQSLGTAVATDIATKRDVGSLVLEAPFPSTSAMARRVFPYLPGLGLVAKSRFDTKRKVSQLNVPVLIAQCTSDPVIPPTLGQEVYRAAREPKFLLQVPGVCHEEASLVAPDLYKSRLQEFLQFVREKGKR